MGNTDKLLFTKQGTEFLLDEKRFKDHGYFPPMASTSTSYLYPALFSTYWESNVWPITPFTDPRLVLFSRNMPVSKVNTSSSKRKMWLNRKDIFLDEQFIKGWHMDSLFNNFIVERQKLLIPILENSILTKLGYFRGKKIAKDLKIEEFGLKISEQKRSKRKKGCTKVHSNNSNIYGAINLKCDKAV